MNYKLSPSTINYQLSTINLPASKSISNRALILNALAYSNREIKNLSDCDDTRVMVKALDSDKAVFDIGAAGTAMRFLTAFLSKIGGEWTITGSERMKNRPIRLLVDALNSLGAKVSYLEKDGFPPLKITGTALVGGTVEMEGNVSSQYISALLMIAPTMRDGLTLKLKGTVISRPYILLTLKMMSDFGIKYSWNENMIHIPYQDYKPVPYEVESDWSAASYWYEIIAFIGKNAEGTSCKLAPVTDIKLLGLQQNSAQGDAKVAEIFRSLGVATEYGNDGVHLIYNGNIAKRLDYDFIEQPDLAQTFAVTCCMLGVPFRFSGLQSLKIKETDRIAALIAELHKFGFVLSETADGVLEWNGERAEPDSLPSVRTYEDHRMAMAFAPVCLCGKTLIIENPEVVNKSYPNFWKDLQKIGIVLEIML
ncbi:MAG: 3-phosphoshikimate 1-carboxyvinyltransferase [Prevotellaceae bacterium]|nr:3-phosphoshikimate 1-carboxyvinyltransferase [Prevotellaceae bacterium]